MISVIIPVQNESDTISQLVRSALGHPGVDQVIVVDDGSIDGTPELARKAGATVLTSTFLGKGASLRDGLHSAKNKIIVCIEARLRTLPKNILAKLTKPLLDEENCVVRARVNASANYVSTFTAKPLLRVFFPEFGGMENPIGGIWAAQRSHLLSLPLEMDYGIEIGIFIDSLMNDVPVHQLDANELETEVEPECLQKKMAEHVTRTILQRAAKYNRLRPGYIDEMEEKLRHSGKELSRILQQADANDRIALFNMDGVLIRGNFILEVAHQLDRGAELAEYLDDPDLLGDELAKKIAALFTGVPKETFEQIAHDIPLMEGAKETVATLRKRGFLVGVVSDSFQVAADVIRCRTFADFSIANMMKFSRGKATGRITFAPAMSSDQSAKSSHDKAHIVNNLTQLTGIPTSQMLVVGNTEEEIGMMNAAGVAIAFRPKSPAVRAVTPYVVDGALSDILNIMEDHALTAVS